MSPRLPLANEDSSMAESLSLKSIEVDVRNLSHIDAKSVDFDMFLNQLMSFDKLVSLCQYCSKNITPVASSWALQFHFNISYLLETQR